MRPLSLHIYLRWKRLQVLLRSSLALRIVLVFLGLLLAVQTASFVVIRAAIDGNAREAIAAELEVGERLLMRLLDQNAQKLTQGASLLAADYGFRAALVSDDEQNISLSLAHHGERIGATVAALLDTQLRLRAAAQPGLEELQPAMQRMAARAAGVNSASDVVVLGGRPFQLVMVPMKTPLVVGWVVMGFPIDQSLLDDMRALSALQVNVQVHAPGAAQAGWQTSVSTLLADAARESVVRQSAAPQAAPAGVLSVPQPPAHASGVLRLPDGEYSARTVMLAQNHSGAVQAVLMRSVGAAVAPYRKLQLGLAALTLIGLMVFVLGSVVTARRVIGPIRKLAVAVERLRAGDYLTPLRGQTRTDEIGKLAQSFERMRVSVASQQQEILKLAYWDNLTGLPNRVQFRNAVQEAMKTAGPLGRGAAVVMLDLDRFKHINDVLGYHVGDLLLKAVAERLQQQAVRGGDMVARLDGDEFAVLLTELEPASGEALARGVAQRIHAALDGSITLGDHAVDTSASVGLALWPAHAADADTLLNRAEVAMYEAKRLRDGPALYDPAGDVTSTRTLTLLTDLRRAVEQNELRLFLQPKLALSDGRIVGAEALLRWQHPQRGMVPPLDFIPFAEQTGFVRNLTQWVFDAAAQLWPRLNQAGVSLTISINLSTRDLLDQDLPQKFEALLVRHQVPAEAFCLEITESAIMDDPQRALATLERLSKQGFKLSIDDFGTGYSSLAYLKRLPVDELKIDKSFVISMEKDEADARIVRSTIDLDLAHGMGLSVVAEGVENAQIWELLRAQNCDEAQGFHMSRPLPEAEFIRWATLWAVNHPGARPSAPGGSAGNATGPSPAVLLH